VVTNALISTIKTVQSFYFLRLRAPAIAKIACPGQFVMIKIAKTVDPLLPRPLSIHGVEKDSLLFFYQLVGRGTYLLSRVKKGERILLWGPLGHSFDLSLRHPVIVAGGMGIAPMVFLIKKLTQKIGENGRQLSLLYGLSSIKNFEDYLCYLFYDLEIIPLNFFLVTNDGSVGIKGLVTTFLFEFLERGIEAILSCGPMPMLKTVANFCAKYNIYCQVSLEAPMACGVGSCWGCVFPSVNGGFLRVCQDGPVIDSMRVDWKQL